MTARIFSLELRLLARERSAWVLCGLFALTLAIGLLNGAAVAGRQQMAANELTRASQQFLDQVRQAVAQEPVDPRAVARGGSVALLPAAPIAWLAIGQSDLTPNHETVSLFRLQGPPDSRAELDNPSLLLTGRLDLAFALIWLFPLVLLALTYDLIAGDRESGTLRFALAQGVPPWRWISMRALARGSPILALAGVATLLAGAGHGAGSFSRLLIALLVVFTYGAFWLALAAAVNMAARGAASAAASLGAAWVALVLIAPTLLNLAVETIYPVPSRPELVAAARRATNEAEQRGGEVLQSFYRDHPELAPPEQQADFISQHLAVQEEVGKAIDPVRRRFDEQLSQQQTLVSRWRFASPAIAAYEALTDLAGTGYWRQRAFREQVEEFKKTLAAFYAPKIHRRQPITSMDMAAFPRFIFREEPVSEWRLRAAISVVSLMAATLLMAGSAWLGLRSARLTS